MAYKLKSQDLKDATAGTTSAAIRAGGEERKAQRAEMKEIRQGLRDTRKSIKQIDKSINWDDPSGDKIDDLRALGSRKEGLLKKKADIKDWSTRKRVTKGGKEGVNLHGNIEAHTKKGEALYKSGSYYGDTKVDISDIRAGQEADTEMNTGGTQYVNKYTLKGDYKHSIPLPPEGSVSYSPPKRPPGSSTRKKDESKKTRWKKGFSFKKGRYDAQNRNLRQRNRYVEKSGSRARGNFWWRGKNA